VTRSSPYLQRHQQSVLGNRIELRHDNSLFGLASQWSAGLDWSRMRQSLYPKSGSWSDTVNPTTSTPAASTPSPA
jgi:iron complex outermembrane receptor protein